jgi:cytochrome P450
VAILRKPERSSSRNGRERTFAASQRRDEAGPSGSLTFASLPDTLAVLLDVALPNIAKGPLIRRPAAVRMAERLGLDRRAVRRMQALRARYGPGPLMLRLPGRRQAVLLEAAHARRVLDETPEPFAAASSEKRAALAHFQPEGVLISSGSARAERRHLNELALDANKPCHRLSDRFAEVIAREAHTLTENAEPPGFGWHAFHDAWYRAVRTAVLGEGARDDRRLTEMLDRLRRDANWAFLKPRRDALRRRFEARLDAHLARAEPGSIAAMLVAMPRGPDAAPAGQVPQWLFAFDAAGIATLRALALLSAHPEAATRARNEAFARGTELPFLRACLLESVRLWPTTPMILRQTTRATEWEGRQMPPGTGVLILAPFFCRDDERLPFADRFTPELWLSAGEAERRGVVPFSIGPAACPGRNLVLLFASHFLADLLRQGWVHPTAPTGLDSAGPLPATLDHLRLCFGPNTTTDAGQNCRSSGLGKFIG